jgi:hypothetical protein
MRQQTPEKEGWFAAKLTHGIYTTHHNITLAL